MSNYLFGYSRRRNRKGSGSKLITLVIYGLTGYIILSLLNSGVGKFFSQDLLLAAVKKIASSNLLYIEYMSKEDKNILEENTDKISMFKEVLNSPANDYYDKKVPINVAMDSSVGFYLSNALINEYNETVHQDEEELNSTDKLKDSEEKNNSNGNSNNELNTDNSNNTDKNVDADGTAQNVSGSIKGFEKVRDIKTEELTYDYLMRNFYTVVSGTTLYESDIEAGKLMNIDMKMTTGNDKPQILIYHTHGQEGFADSVSGDRTTGIVGVGDYLTEILTNQYGYNVIHLTDSFDYVNGVLDRSKAYDYAYEKVAQVLADNPSIEVVIDLHRDGVNENLHLVTEVNGKQTAKIMFFNGISRLNSIGEIGYLYNPYREQNLAMSLQMKVLAEEYFEGFTRKNYIQAYQYNLHLRPKSMLIEAGAQTNSLQEVKNAMEPLAFLLNELLNGS